MFALEFVNFVYDAREFSSKSGVFYNTPFGIRKNNGFLFGLSSGIVPGDFYGGGIFSFRGVGLEMVAYRSGHVLLTTWPDTSNQPVVIERANFLSGKLSLRMVWERGNFAYGFKTNLFYAKFLNFWGSGGGIDAFVGYFGEVLGYFGINNTFTSPVIWNTGRKEFAFPEVDFRLGKDLGIPSIYFGFKYSPDGRKFIFKRDLFLSSSLDFGSLSLFGGYVEGFPRLGLELKRGNYGFLVGSSYHTDLGFSFRGGFYLELR
jgi:hypothetical protein